MSEIRQDRQIANLGKAMIQVNLRLNRVLELLEDGGAGGREDAHLEPLLDLIEAAERTLEGAALPAAPRGWLRRWLAPPEPPQVDLEGLRIALARIVDGLRASGVEPAPREGAVDPRIHQVIEVIDTEDSARHEGIARVHRRGWLRPGDPPAVLRQAQVSAWRHTGDPS